MNNVKYIVQIGEEVFEFGPEHENAAISFASMARNYSKTKSKITIELVDTKTTKKE